MRSQDVQNAQTAVVYNNFYAWLSCEGLCRGEGVSIKRSTSLEYEGEVCLNISQGMAGRKVEDCVQGFDACRSCI